MDWERYLHVRDLQHELELALMEERLAEYVGLKTELEIRREADFLRALKGFKLLGVEGWGYKEPPRLKRVFPRATTDWDFATTNWTLDSSVFVSAPSSLKFTETCFGVLCRSAGTTNLSQGRIVQYVRWFAGQASNRTSWNARNQSAVGVTSYTNTYMFILRGDPSAGWEVSKWVGGIKTVLASGNTYLTGAFSAGVWYQVRTTWWKSAAVLVLRAERLNGAWAKIFNDVVDAAPSFEGSGTNRCGPGSWADPGLYVDDTEIWGP